MVSAAQSFTEVARSVEAGGDAALAQIGSGPFLIEIPTVSPLGLGAGPTPTSHGTSARTIQYDEQLLLDLRRSRDSEARIHVIYPGAVIGRGSDCAIQLAGEDSVSKHHAVFQWGADGWILEDKGTTNGTFVDRERLPSGESAPLPEIVAVQFGSRRFAFVEGPYLVALLQPPTSTDVIPISQLRTELETLGSRRFGLRHSIPYVLVGYKGEGNTSQTNFKPTDAFPLLGDGPLRVGRTGQAEITLRRNSVSKWHAKFEPVSQRWTLADTGSSNGTAVNGSKLPKGQPTKLSSWDAIAFGPSTWGLYLESRALLEWLLEGEQ